VECPQYRIRLEALGYLCDCLSGRVQRQQVVKVIWHKAHRHHIGGWFNVIRRVTATCSPMRAQWRHQANTIELVHPSVHSSPQPKRQMNRFSHFLQSLRHKVPIIYNGRPIHQNCPFPWGIWTSHVTHDAFGPCQPTTQTAPRSVQPCFHRWQRSVPILDNGLPVSPSKLPLPMLASEPHVIRGSLGPPESGTEMATWSFQPFLQGWLVWQPDKATDRPTDHATQCDAA